MFGAEIGGNLAAEFVEQAGIEDTHQGDLATLTVALIGVVGRGCDVLLGGIEVKVLPAHSGEGIGDVEGVAVADGGILADEQGGWVIGAVLFTFEGFELCGDHHIDGLLLELDDEGNAEEILFSGNEVESLVFAERATNGTAELILFVIQLATEGVG